MNFQLHISPDGVQLVFATLADGGCAILRDDEIVEVFPKDAESVNRAVTLFQHLTDGRARIAERP